MPQKKIAEYRLANIGERLDSLAIIRIDTPKLRESSRVPHVVDGISVALCVEGYMRFKINFKEEILERGKLLVVFPYSLIEPLEVSDDYTIYSFMYSVDYVSSVPIASNYDVWYKLHNFPCINITEKEIETIEKYFNFMLDIYNDPQKNMKSEILKYITMSLRLELRTLYANLEDKEPGVLTRAEQITRDFLELIYTHFKQERNVAFYADKMHLTPKYLTTIIRQQTGYTILTWISQVVTISAKQILRTTDKTVQEIAYEFHFSDSSLFCRFFKRYVGMSPNEYRFAEDK